MANSAPAPVKPSLLAKVEALVAKVNAFIAAHPKTSVFVALGAGFVLGNVL